MKFKEIGFSVTWYSGLFKDLYRIDIIKTVIITTRQEELIGLHVHDHHCCRQVDK